MADITIPGVSDKYKTSDLIEGLMKAERVPLTREQETLDKYKGQQDAWRDVNQKMVSLRESVKALYSFENPFNNKLTSSSADYAITASSARDATCGDYKIDVLNVASADRFLSDEIQGDTDVPQGIYTYSVGTKTISMTWKGGKLTDFVTALNKRAPDTLKASLIGVSGAKKALLIEGLKTGRDNALVFKDAALDFAKQTKMLDIIKDDIKASPSTIKDLKEPTDIEGDALQVGMPALSASKVTRPEDDFVLPPRTGYLLSVSEDILADKDNCLQITIQQKTTEDITVPINESQMTPQLPQVGSVEFRDITIENSPLENALPAIDPKLPQMLQQIDDTDIVFVKNQDGTITNVPIADFLQDDGSYKVNIKLKDFREAVGIEIHNINTGKTLLASDISYFRVSPNGDLGPQNPVSKADDAVLKYEGITIARPTNTIDDVIPNVTLNVSATTDRTATISVKPDVDSAKEALINFVGKYNQVMAQMNILTQNKPEIIAELDYLSKEEKEQSTQQLGMFLGDSALTNGKVTMQRIVTSVYKTPASDLSMLSQMGISSNASGSSGGYNPTQLRGYLEMDEKKLDSFLETKIDQIKNLFGYDSDNDLIIDTGIAFSLDKQLGSWVQSGGLIANRTGTLDKRIKSSEQKIDTLEDQLAKKESQLKQKYGAMEGSLNSLQSQSNSITNFTNQSNNNNKR